MTDNSTKIDTIIKQLKDCVDAMQSRYDDLDTENDGEAQQADDLNDAITAAEDAIDNLNSAKQNGLS